MTRKHGSSLPALIISGGPIVTMDPACPQAEAVLCRNGRIVWTGKKVDIPRLPGVRTKHIDLNGRLLLPAFCDGHTHFLYMALDETRIALNDAHNLQEALKTIRRGLAKVPRSGWVQGAGFNKNIWPNRDRLRKEDLDKIIPDRPAAFFSKDEHTLWVNSKALAIAGITADTPDPEGGQIERDSRTGEPTGRLTENAYRLVWAHVPPAAQAYGERVVQRAFDRAYAVGVTQVHDVGSENSFEIFQSLYSKNKLRLRVLHARPVGALDDLARTGFRSGLGDEMLRLGPIKVFLDGALGSQTAHLKRPYTSDRSTSGVSIYTADEFNAVIGKAFRAGWAVAVHAIGDAAVRRALDGFLKHRRKMPRAIASRIEHAQLLDPADISDFAKAGIAASMQPSHLLADRATAEKHWGRRARWSFAFKTLQKAGIPLVFGSDTPIELLSPLEGIYAAVCRRPDDPRRVWTPAERLSVYDAVFGFTQATAVASGESALKGSITPGKVADFTVLSENIFTIPPDEITNVAVDLTVFNGDMVYLRKEG